jgi:hypothetical protein
MAKHTLFLVHGMGRHDGTQWADEIWQKLVDCSELYPHYQTKKKLVEYAEPAPITYDGFIRQALARWDSQATSFKDFAQGNELQHAGALDWLTGISDDDAGFVASHILDVIIYRFFRLEAGQIRTHVQTEIATIINGKREMDAGAEFSLMAHSLGTSVAHDALAKLGSMERIGANVNTLSTSNLRFKSIHMLANVSRVLQTKPKAYDSVVRPGPRSTKNRYCGRMFCHSHELDPFLFPKPFEPESWGSDYRARHLRHYRGWNIHSWLHYLDNPRVHIPLLKSITKPSAIPPSIEREAVDAYTRFGGDLENVAAAQTKIRELHAVAQEIDEDRGLEENFKTIIKMYNLLVELKEIAGETWATLERSLP